PVRTVPGTATTGIIVPGDVALDSTGNLYVANNNGNNILVYPPGVSGSWPPARTISGASTGLSGGTRGIVLDSAGNLFVAVYTNSIVMFAPGANGNVAPLRTISGTNTGLNVPVGAAL